MTRTPRNARQFLILMRDALGRFIRIRVTPEPAATRPRRRRLLRRLDVQQLTLF